jgi:inosose dehydratase
MLERSNTPAMHVVASGKRRGGSNAVTDLLDRIAGAPISWGVCEVPGWGPMLPAPRVLRELRSVGLRSIELGAPGFLPADPVETRELLAEHGVRLVGGFVPLVLHDSSAADAALRNADDVSRLLATMGATVFVTAVVVDEGWSPPRPLTDGEWAHVVAMLERLDGVTREHGIEHVLHPHAGTLVETADDVERVLGASDVRWCLDTGHLTIGGVDPVEFARAHAHRVGHVHLKDVDESVVVRFRAGEVTLLQAVEAHLFPPLGRGDVAVDEVVRHLERSGYQGWYVLEQDTSIQGAAPPEGEGPVHDVATSVAYVHRALTAAHVA